MLMEDRQIAVNDVVVACLEAADHYRDDAGRFEEAALSGLFERAAVKHQDIAETLQDQVRRLGALPREPDTEREQAQQLASRLKANFSLDECRTVLDERIEAEKHIESLIDAALQYELPAAAVDCLDQARGVVAEVQRRLAASRSSSSG